jgi:hypothetical protein
LTIITFIFAEAVGLFGLYLTWKGVFGLGFAFLLVLVMLALSFHVMARNPRADATSTMMGCFSAMLWYMAFLAGKIFLEFRGWTITLAAFAFMAIVGAVAIASTWSVIERPTDYDVEEAE